jgi:hypothetical protein
VWIAGECPARRCTARDLVSTVCIVFAYGCAALDCDLTATQVAGDAHYRVLFDRQPSGLCLPLPDVGTGSAGSRTGRLHKQTADHPPGQVPDKGSAVSRLRVTPIAVARGRRRCFAPTVSDLRRFYHAFAQQSTPLAAQAGSGITGPMNALQSLSLPGPAAIMAACVQRPARLGAQPRGITPHTGRQEVTQ